MDAGSDERVRQALHQAVSEFHAGLYFECHETIESVWRDENDPFLKDFLQGFIHVAVAMVHLRRGNRVGATLQMTKGRHRLQSADLKKFGRIFGCTFDELEQQARGEISPHNLRPRSSIG